MGAAPPPIMASKAIEAMSFMGWTIPSPLRFRNVIVWPNKKIVSGQPDADSKEEVCGGQRIAGAAGKKLNRRFGLAVKEGENGRG